MCVFRWRRCGSIRRTRRISGSGTSRRRRASSRRPAILITVRVRRSRSGAHLVRRAASRGATVGATGVAPRDASSLVLTRPRTSFPSRYPVNYILIRSDYVRDTNKCGEYSFFFFKIQKCGQKQKCRQKTQLNIKQRMINKNVGKHDTISKTKM